MEISKALDKNVSDQIILILYFLISFDYTVLLYFHTFIQEDSN